MDEHTYTVPDSPKTLRETLCRAEVLISHREWDVQFIDRDMAVIGHLISECDRKRPLGSDGKHDDRHTSECGCFDD